MASDYGRVFKFSSPFTTFEIGICTPPHGCFTLELQQRAFLRYVGRDIILHRPRNCCKAVAEAFNDFFNTRIPPSTIDTRRKTEMDRKSVFFSIRNTDRSQVIRKQQQRQFKRQLVKQAIAEARVIGFESAIQSTASSTLNSTHRRNLEMRDVSKSLGVSSVTHAFVKALHPAIKHNHEGSIYDVVSARAEVCCRLFKSRSVPLFFQSFSHQLPFLSGHRSAFGHFVTQEHPGWSPH